jgi:hypothetical protein
LIGTLVGRVFVEIHRSDDAKNKTFW